MSELIKKHKNISVFICFSIVALSFAFATYFAIQMFEGEKGGKWFGLVYGVPTVLLTLFIHLIGNRIRFFHIVSLLMNAVASGLCVSSYYMVKEISVDIYELLVGCLPAVCVILLMWVLGKIRCLSANVPPTTAAILCCILMALAILMWIFDGSVFFSFGFFLLLTAAFYTIAAMDTEDKDRDVLKAISIMSFGAFALVAVIVIALVSGEDFLSGVDFGGGKKKKK